MFRFSYLTKEILRCHCKYDECTAGFFKLFSYKQKFFSLLFTFLLQSVRTVAIWISGGCLRLGRITVLYNAWLQLGVSWKG